MCMPLNEPKKSNTVTLEQTKYQSSRRENPLTMTHKKKLYVISIFYVPYKQQILNAKIVYGPSNVSCHYRLKKSLAVTHSKIGESSDV
jgi:hypothetical protein